jgi:hypothetical protein
MSTLKVDTITKADGTNSISQDAIITTSSPQLGRRNLIINGAMQVAQRGTSFTGIGNGDDGYTLDRWNFNEGGTPPSEFTISQDSDAPSGFHSSLKMQTTSAGNINQNNSISYLTLEQKIEDRNVAAPAYGTSDAKEMTLSFWVKSYQTGTFTIWFWRSDPNRSSTVKYTVNSSGTWEYKTVTIPADTTGVVNNTGGEGFRVVFCLAAGSDYTTGTSSSSWKSHTGTGLFEGQTVDLGDSTSNYFAITGVQLEVGSVATPFEHRSYGEELALCERYYWKSDITNSYYSFVLRPDWIRVFQIQFPTTMRADPTVTFTYNDDSSGVGFNAALVCKSYWRGSTGAVTASNRDPRITAFAADAEL